MIRCMIRPAVASGAVSPRRSVWWRLLYTVYSRMPTQEGITERACHLEGRRLKYIEDVRQRAVVRQLQPRSLVRAIPQHRRRL